MILGLLGAVLSGDLLIAAVLVIGIWYLFRGKSAAATVAGVMGTASAVAMGVLAVLALGIALGWFDPNPAKVGSDLVTGAGVVLEALKGLAIDQIKGLLP